LTGKYVNSRGNVPNLDALTALLAAAITEHIAPIDVDHRKYHCDPFCATHLAQKVAPSLLEAAQRGRDLADEILRVLGPSPHLHPPGTCDGCEVEIKHALVAARSLLNDNAGTAER
jgi:hypothetical protein